MAERADCGGSAVYHPSAYADEPLDSPPSPQVSPPPMPPPLPPMPPPPPQGGSSPRGAAAPSPRTPPASGEGPTLRALRQRDGGADDSTTGAASTPQGQRSAAGVVALDKLAPSCEADGAEAEVSGGEGEEGELDLMYDPVLDCYYDPKTNKYYELRCP